MEAVLTKEEFLNEWRSEHKDWAGKAHASNIATPPDEKIAQGWVLEHPSHEYFNWHMNRTDRRLRELEAKVAWLEKLLTAKGE